MSGPQSLAGALATLNNSNTIKKTKRDERDIKKDIFFRMIKKRGFTKPQEPMLQLDPL